MDDPTVPQADTVEIVVHHIAYMGGGYIGVVALPAGQTPAFPDGVVEVVAPPADADEIWTGDRWAQPARHYADATGVYIGEMERGTQGEGCVETSGAPADATDQLWNVAANQWQWKPHFFRTAEGDFWGSYVGPDKPADLIEVTILPQNGRQKWLDGVWAPLPEDI